jgi:uncharacterized protein
MTVRIVDRRFDSKKKSSINRARFLRRYRAQIREAVTGEVSKRGVRDIDTGGKVSVPGRDIAEPQFGLGRGGQRDMVHPGNDRFLSGDEVERPQGGGGGGSGSGSASKDGEGLDEFAFTLTREEFLDIFFDELALPNLVKRQLAQIDEYRKVRAGYTHTGVPTNINLVRTMRGAAGRRIATGGPHLTKLLELEDALHKLLEEQRAPDDPEVEALRREIALLRVRIEKIPFIDSFDLRYTNRIRVPQPSTRAVMFCLMDVSGSMDENRKNIAKRFFMLLYLFLTRNYRHVDVVFIRHHTVASEVDENDFFHARESGGTVVSSALALMLKIVQARYPGDLWNIYAAQASDGDNFDDDSPRCRELLESKLVAKCQYYAYIEIANPDPHSLWREYEKLLAGNPGRFSMQRIATAADIYPVFRELFRKRA